MYRPEFPVGVTGLQVSDTARPIAGNVVDDDLLTLTWRFPKRKLDATIVNKSPGVLTIDWPRAKFTDFGGDVHGFRDNSGKAHPQKLETIIHPGQAVVESIYPAAYINQRGMRTRLQPNMRATEHRDRVESFGQGNLGKHAFIKLPIRQADSTTRLYVFRLATLEFSVDKFVGT